ncbi:MAG: glycosyltransferase family 1 protein [Candidatus Magasanikbacteria bacterium]
MNIGIDIRCLADKNRTGVGEYTLGLLNALFESSQEHQYYLFYNSFSDVSAYLPIWKHEHVHVIHTFWPNKLFHFCIKFLRYPKIDRLLQKEIDIFFSPNLHFTCLSKQVKHIQTIHDLSFEHFPEFFSVKRRLWHSFINPKVVCRNADLIITPSHATRRDVIETYGIPDQKVQTIHPGVLAQKRDVSSMEEIKKAYDLPVKYILFLGTIEPRKNILALIRAFELSHLRSQNFELIIAGSKGWKCGDILEVIDSTPGVRYIGYVPEGYKQSLYRAARVFVFPSLYEGFGFPVLEARRVGTTVITSHRSSLSEVGGHGVHYVNPMDISSLVRALQYICSGQDSHPVELFEEGEHTWEEGVKQFFSACKEI